MNKTPAVPSVLIVDEDLGFLSWLGDLFTEVGYQTLPALNCRQAVSMIKKFNIEVDVIAIHDSLPGASGMIGRLNRAQRPFRIVAIRDRDAEGFGAIAAHATLERPSGWESISRPAWLRKVLMALKQAEAKAAI